ncbi:MAG: hypothetical protein R2911_22635 [Caldilineaceae bacterium]
MWLGLKITARRFLRISSLACASTVYYSVATVALGVSLSLVAAMLLNQNIMGRAFIVRSTISLLTPVVALAILWRWLLQPIGGARQHIAHMWPLPAQAG